MAKPAVQRQIDKNKSSITLEPYQVILKPLVTEKSVELSDELNKYSFAVSSVATKLDVRRAIEKLFSVKVAKVAVQNRKGKPKRYRQFGGRTKNWKRAIVTLVKDDRIDLFS
jgi:large subunit ribosomal protein L23